MAVPQSSWLPIELLADRRDANIAAIAGRDPELAANLTSIVPSAAYHIRTENDRVILGSGEPGAIEPLPPLLSPATAQATRAKLFPADNYSEPVLIAGEDLGWLWNSLYEMKCVDPAAPGYRAPIYFLIRDLERLWVILHIQDWPRLLADNRVRLFAGDDCLDQFRKSLLEQVMCRWPMLSVAVDPAIWPAGVTLESCLVESRVKQTAELARLRNRLEAMYADFTPPQAAELYHSDRKMRVLGLTSRYSTFIQYSMRDWLEAFERLGHETFLLIESADHEQPNNLAVASACEKFKPDLIVAIDHYREELAGVPPQVPVVMWVQDRLSSIYCPDAGRQQTRLDYTIGYGMLELTQAHGYPHSRFMPTMMAVNEKRFAPRALTASETARYGCEVSFVTNCTMPAGQIVQEAAQSINNPRATKLIDEIYQRLLAVYEAGSSVTTGDGLRAIIQQTMLDQRVNTEVDVVLDLFSQRVNNALFRHQAIRWVAEMDVDLHLYGKGWEANPEFAKYARGIADNQTQLPTIYQASAINLQVTPFGAVHQRLLDGVAAGGFFLLRSTTADQLELILRDMHGWCERHQVHSGAEMVARQDAELQHLTSRYAQLDGVNPMHRPDYFFGALGECALSGWTRSATTLWTNSDRVIFTRREEMQSQIRYFLSAPEERRELAASMRQRVLETHTYQSITRRLLDFIGSDLRRLAPLKTQKAA